MTELNQTIHTILSELRPEADFTASTDYLTDGLLDSTDIVSLVASLDGSEVLRATRRGHDDETALLGQAVADDLLDRGARTILDEVDRVMSASTGGLERPR